MHLQVYRDRPDARAVVHAHPPTATGFAVAGIPLDRAVLAEVVTTLGSIPIAEYATPSTDELPAACSKYLKAHDGLLLANHGALAIGPDLFTAYHRMETIEHFAKISLVTRMLGRENLLVARGSPAAAGAARDVRHRLAGAGLHRRRRGRSVAGGQVECQVVQAPDRAAGARLVADMPLAARPTSRTVAVRTGRRREIRLTYRELTALDRRRGPQSEMTSWSRPW